MSELKDFREYHVNAPFRALFIPTGNSGITYWRMHNFHLAAHRTGIAQMPVLWWSKGADETHSWERDIVTEMKYRLIPEMLAMAKLADVIIFGMLHGCGVRRDDQSKEDYINQSLTDFRALRDVFPNTPILSEIDDNMLSTPDYNPANPFYDPKDELREIAVRQFRESDGLIVSTPYLKELYSDFNPNIHIVPNSIDDALWSKARKSRKPGIRIGWAGGASHNEDLEMLKEVIPAIRSRHKNVKFVFLHGCPEFLRKLDGVEFHANWTRIDKYPQKLASLDFDIGIAPLVDNAFNRGKSNLRWLEYSALGIPTVASNVGHFAETIRGGIDGLLADSPKEFIECLSKLISDKKERSRMGAAARARVLRDFNVDTTAKDYVKFLAGVKVQPATVEVLQ